jgi:hypothetical protein
MQAALNNILAHPPKCWMNCTAQTGKRHKSGRRLWSIQEHLTLFNILRRYIVVEGVDSCETLINDCVPCHLNVSPEDVRDYLIALKFPVAARTVKKRSARHFPASETPSRKPRNISSSESEAVSTPEPKCASELLRGPIRN